MVSKLPENLGEQAATSPGQPDPTLLSGVASAMTIYRRVIPNRPMLAAEYAFFNSIIRASTTPTQSANEGSYDPLNDDAGYHSQALLEALKADEAEITRCFPRTNELLKGTDTIN